MTSQDLVDTLLVLTTGTPSLVLIFVLAYGSFKKYKRRAQAARLRAALTDLRNRNHGKDNDMDWKPHGLIAAAGTQPSAPPTPHETNRDALNRLLAVQMKDYNAHAHTGPQADYVFTAPAIFDVAIPATAAYLDAVADAETLLAGADPDVAANRATTRAVNLVEQRWNAAVDFARRNINTVFDPEQRRRMARLVDVVAHGGADSAEAEVARDRLVAMLSEVTYTVEQVGGVTKSVRLNPNALFVPDRAKSVAPAASKTQIGA